MLGEADRAQDPEEIYDRAQEPEEVHARSGAGHARLDVRLRHAE